jgi:adenosylhomocysteine nucleosidase
MTGRVAFVCAMPLELTPLRRKLSLRKTRLGSLDLHAGTLLGRPVVAIVTGMGAMLAARGLRRLIDAVEVERVVVVGIAGAMEADTPIGALVVPEVVVNAATGAEYRPDSLGEVAPRGKMWTTDELITDLATIARLRAEGVVALEMETAAIAETCVARSMPWSVFRAVSDRATDVSLDDEVFRLVNQDGSLRPKAIVSHFVRHPGRVRSAIAVFKDAKLAAERAAEAAIVAVARSTPAGTTPQGS